MKRDTFDTIEDAIADIRAGKLVIVVDDEDRENEGDFICAAQTITPELVNFMASVGRGLICVPMSVERTEALDLDMMVQRNTGLYDTPLHRLSRLSSSYFNRHQRCGPCCHHSGIG